MSKALEAAARAADEVMRAEVLTGHHGDRLARAIAQEAILAFLRETDAVELGAAVRDAENPTHAAIARALIKALTRLAEGQPAP